MGGAGTAGRCVPAAGEGGAAEPAPDDERNPVASSERSEVAGGAGGAGTWWKAAQTFIRWTKLGVWEQLLLPVQNDRVELGMTFLDGTNIRAYQEAAGAPRKRTRQKNATNVRRWADLGAALERKLA